jgi:CheY-like chemotaxis protein
MIHIKVKDTGVGIAPADQERIFDAFYQVRSPESKNLGGTGLGLTIVQQIVNLLGGEIKVESQPGIGTTFELFFKAESHGAINVVQPTEEDFSLGPVANLSVLVVDDSEVNLLLMQSILKVFGVEADTATNGEEAVMAFEKKYYELVFMDINMPRLDGLSATRKIRESNPESKIQIYGISANAFSEDKEKALSAGMTGYLTKPMTMSNIRNVLAQCRP